MSTNISSSFTVCSFNMDTIIGYLKRTNDVKGAKVEDYKEAVDTTFESLKSRGMQVLCFQECWDTSELVSKYRYLIRDTSKIIKKYFPPNQFTQIAKYNYTILLLDNNRFTSIENLSSSNMNNIQNLAIATAIDRITQKKVAFVSAQLTRFDIVKANPEAALNSAEVNQIIKILKERCSDCELQVIGIDMNSDRKVNPDGPGQERFKIFIQQGFKILQTGKGTNFTLEEKPNEREFDYFIFKNAQSASSCWEKFKSFFIDTISYSASPATTTDHDWTDPTLCSGHKPIFTSIQTVVPAGYKRLMSWLWSWIR